MVALWGMNGKPEVGPSLKEVGSWEECPVRPFVPQPLTLSPSSLPVENALLWHIFPVVSEWALWNHAENKSLLLSVVRYNGESSQPTCQSYSSSALCPPLISLLKL